MVSMVRPERKFEDLEVGEQRRSLPRAITQEDIVAFARQYDPQWFHAEPDNAKQSIFGEVVASGIHLLAIWRQLDHEMNSDIDFVCGVGWDEVRMKKAVRPGDTVCATSQIVSLAPSRSGKARGTAITRYALVNQHGEEVLSFLSTNLVYSRGVGHSSP